MGQGTHGPRAARRSCNQTPHPAKKLVVPPESPRSVDDTVVRFKVPIKLRGKQVGVIGSCCGHAGPTPFSATVANRPLSQIRKGTGTVRKFPSSRPISPRRKDKNSSKIRPTRRVRQSCATVRDVHQGQGNLGTRWKLDHWPGMPSPRPVRRDECPAGFPVRTCQKQTPPSWRRAISLQTSAPTTFRSEGQQQIVLHREPKQVNRRQAIPAT